MIDIDPSVKPLRLYSDGSGTQSVAVIVLQALGMLPKPYDVFVFANVGAKSEKSETLAYRRDHLEPFAAAHGITLIERQRTIRGKPVDLFEYTLSDNRSIPIPVKFPDQGFGNRSCTSSWKTEVVDKYITHETGETHVEMGIGFSSEEGSRIAKKYPHWHDAYLSRKPDGSWHTGKKIGYGRKYEFPLAELRMNRAQCQKLITDAGLPPAPSSICTYCPFTTRETWAQRKRDKDIDPTYYKALEVEDMLNEKYQRIRSHHPKASSFVAIHRDGISLRDIPDQLTLWDEYMDTDESCTIGYCGV